MGVFDTIAVKHDCPNCHGERHNYQTKQLTGCMGEYRMGEPINLGRGPDFDFGLYDSCGSCGVTIVGVGAVRNHTLCEVRELGYTDERAAPTVHYDRPMDIPKSYRNEKILVDGRTFDCMVPVGKKTIYPEEQPFVPNERIVASV